MPTHGHCVIMARGMGRDGRLGKAGKAGKIGTAVIASIIRRKKKSKQASSYGIKPPTLPPGSVNLDKLGQTIAPRLSVSWRYHINS